MNPILMQMVNRQQSQQRRNNTTGDNRTKVMSMVGGLSAEQKAKFQSYFPAIQNIAKRMGYSDEQINQSFSELQSRM